MLNNLVYEKNNKNFFYKNSFRYYHSHRQQPTNQWQQPSTPFFPFIYLLRHSFSDEFKRSSLLVKEVRIKQKQARKEWKGIT